jgi:CheY-like chemotaxis protein
LRILVADDSIPNQQVARAMLERSGHSVDVAANGLEAVEAVRHIPYDLVLMDMHMPEMDGVEATRRIRALDGAAAHLPILAMTASTQESDMELCREAGMNDFVAKPVNRAGLLSSIDRALASHSES